MKTILSFDVGIRHLAFCMFEQHSASEADCKITQWDVIDLGPVGNVETCALRLMEECEKRFRDLKVDLVLIERQPKSRSIIMVAVQMFLCSYFSIAKIRGTCGDIRFISAQRKLMMKHAQVDEVKEVDEVDGLLLQDKKTKKKADKTNYAANKKYAIVVTRHYLEYVLKDFGNLVLLDMYKKKDDLCDSFLQGIAYVETGGMCARTTNYKRKTKSKVNKCQVNVK
jgi:hypothetical protein